MDELEYFASHWRFALQFFKAVLEDGVEVGGPLVEHPVLKLLDGLVLLHLVLAGVGLHRGGVRVLLLLEIVYACNVQSKVRIPIQKQNFRL